MCDININKIIPVNLDYILKTTASVAGLSDTALKTRNRKRELADCRFAYITIARELTKASTIEIGKLINRDHATVLHARKVKHLPEIVRITNEVRKVLYSLNEDINVNEIQINRR